MIFPRTAMIKFHLGRHAYRLRCCLNRRKIMRQSKHMRLAINSPITSSTTSKLEISIFGRCEHSIYCADGQVSGIGGESNLTAVSRHGTRVCFTSQRLGISTFCDVYLICIIARDLNNPLVLFTYYPFALSIIGYYKSLITFSWVTFAITGDVNFYSSPFDIFLYI